MLIYVRLWKRLWRLGRRRRYGIRFIVGFDAAVVGAGE
jgi:hypothetical protein